VLTLQEERGMMANSSGADARESGFPILPENGEERGEDKGGTGAKRHAYVKRGEAGQITV